MPFNEVVDPQILLGALLIGAGVGFLSGAFGKGGSAVSTPLLHALGVPAIATIAGTPRAWRRGVDTAEPPLPNAPDRKPTPAPMSNAPRRICGSTTSLNGIASHR